MAKLYLPRSGGVAEKNYRIAINLSPPTHTDFDRAVRLRLPVLETIPHLLAERKGGSKDERHLSQRGIPGEINTASKGTESRERKEKRRGEESESARSSVGPRGRFLMLVFREAVDRFAIVRIYECLMREGHTSNVQENKRSRTRMEVENRRRHRRVIRDRLASTIGASRKGCSTRRSGHTQCNLTSCKKVPAYFFPQKAFPRPMLAVIDEAVAPISPCPFRTPSPCVVITRFRVLSILHYVGTREHTRSRVEK